MKKNKNPEVTGSSEPRKSQRFKKEKHLYTYFISNDVIVFLVEGDRNTVLKMTHMILNVEDNPKTFRKVMSSKDIVF
jgi:hypothetical protein